MCFCLPKTFFTFRLHRPITGTTPILYRGRKMEAPKTKKGGRPPKTPREKKSFKIELKLNQEDYDKLEKQYRNSGYRNKSDMYYDMLFHRSLRQKDSDTLQVLKEIQDLVREIKGIGATYSRVVSLVEPCTQDTSLAQELQKLTSLTQQLREKEQEMFAIILKLRDKWLHEL